MAKVEVLCGWALVAVFAWPLTTWSFTLVILGTSLVTAGAARWGEQGADSGDSDG